MYAKLNAGSGEVLWYSCVTSTTVKKKYYKCYESHCDLLEGGRLILRGEDSGCSSEERGT
jgi:hypothetical protein